MLSLHMILQYQGHLDAALCVIHTMQSLHDNPRLCIDTTHPEIYSIQIPIHD